MLKRGDGGVELDFHFLPEDGMETGFVFVRFYGL